MARDVARTLDIDGLSALDVHVHLEHTGGRVEADEAARQYFGASADRDWTALAEYYRSRRMACVVFTVDEKLSGRPPVANDAVLEFAAANADVIETQAQQVKLLSDQRPATRSSWWRRVFGSG